MFCTCSEVKASKPVQISSRICSRNLLSKVVTNLEYDTIPSAEIPLLVSDERTSPRAAIVFRASIAATEVCARVIIPTISGGRRVLELNNAVEVFRWMSRSLSVRCGTPRNLPGSKQLLDHLVHEPRLELI